jgi:hypothetical protein
VEDKFFHPLREGISAAFFREFGQAVQSDFQLDKGEVILCSDYCQRKPTFGVARESRQTIVRRFAKSLMIDDMSAGAVPVRAVNRSHYNVIKDGRT